MTSEHDQSQVSLTDVAATVKSIAAHSLAHGQETLKLREAVTTLVDANKQNALLNVMSTERDAEVGAVLLGLVERMQVVERQQAELTEAVVKWSQGLDELLARLTDDDPAEDWWRGDTPG